MSLFTSKTSDLNRGEIYNVLEFDMNDDSLFEGLDGYFARVRIDNNLWYWLPLRYAKYIKTTNHASEMEELKLNGKILQVCNVGQLKLNAPYEETIKLEFSVNEGTSRFVKELNQVGALEVNFKQTYDLIVEERYNVEFLYRRALNQRARTSDIPEVWMANLEGFGCVYLPDCCKNLNIKPIFIHFGKELGRSLFMTRKTANEIIFTRDDGSIIDDIQLFLEQL